MHAYRLAGLTIVIAACATSPGLAQDIGIAGHVGTLGIGISGGIGVHERIGLRASANLIPINPTATVSDIEYTIDPPDPQFQVGADVFLVGAFRLSGGLLVSTPDIVSESDQSGTGSVTVGGTTFTGTDVGTVTGTIINKDVSPYVGLGFGRVGGKRGLSFFLDVGVAFHGEPVVTLESDGSAAGNPLFQQALRDEEDEMEEALKPFRVYPILSLGVSFGF